MADRGPDWARPWTLPGIFWSAAAMTYTPIRIYIRVADASLFHLWLFSRPVVWWLSDRLNALAE